MKIVQPKTQPNLCKKLFTYGVQTLSDTELLTVFIGANQHNTQPAHELLTHLGDLRAVLNADWQHVKPIKQWGKRRYAQLQAAQEMYRRSDYIYLHKELQLNNTRDTHRFLKRQLRDKKYETFAVLFLDSQNRVIAYEELFHGTINSASVHPRPIVERVLKLNAGSVILAHNHPSGISDASCEDIAATDRMRLALELIDTRLLDHLVIGDNEVYSIMHQAKWICH